LTEAGIEPASFFAVLHSPVLHHRSSIDFDAFGEADRPIVSLDSKSVQARVSWQNQPGIGRTPCSPEWYTNSNKQDSGRGTQWNAGVQAGPYPDRDAAADRTNSGCGRRM
jgi:hypothetical protein